MICRDCAADADGKLPPTQCAECDREIATYTVNGGIVVHKRWTGDTDWCSGSKETSGAFCM
jgi:hypothetical protein